uniref:Uncharacterized protein n=1 Tax=Setaria viridis TaxID=4556 RepID=A0A4U6UNF9_SETVI|nr:hypothetical protein SEVIR_5G319632v2 [Setaria viridis]
MHALPAGARPAEEPETAAGSCRVAVGTSAACRRRLWKWGVHAFLVCCSECSYRDPCVEHDWGGIVGMD